ncbi:MAG: uridine kinase [Chlamydiales bacterium]|nr:uridine kinase [Chlamydiales bacterium]
MKKYLCLFVVYISIISSLSAEPIVIAISGGSGAGKSFLAEKLMEVFNEDAVLISEDSYYKDLSHLPKEERALVNFDHPDAIEFSLLREHVKQLKSGKSVKVPTYDFTEHLRTNKTQSKESKKFIIVEGILLLAHPELRDIADVKCFIEADDELRLYRRIERDIRERGRTLSCVGKQYFESVQPMYRQFVLPSKAHADVIIPSNQANPIGVSLVVSALKDKDLLRGV